MEPSPARSSMNTASKWLSDRPVGHQAGPTHAVRAAVPLLLAIRGFRHRLAAPTCGTGHAAPPRCSADERRAVPVPEVGRSRRPVTRELDVGVSRGSHWSSDPGGQGCTCRARPARSPESVRSRRTPGGMPPETRPEARPFAPPCPTEGSAPTAQPRGGTDRGRGADADAASDQQARAGDRQHADTRFARMFTVSPVPLALIAEDGQVLDANPALAQPAEPDT